MMFTNAARSDVAAVSSAAFPDTTGGAGATTGTGADTIGAAGCVGVEVATGAGGATTFLGVSIFFGNVVVAFVGSACGIRLGIVIVGIVTVGNTESFVGAVEVATSGALGTAGNSFAITTATIPK
jgi:hypothetical protein